MKARIDTPLKRILREQGRRQDWLAAQIDAQPSEVSRWVNGLHVPEQATREQIARALGRPVDELWPESEMKAAA